MSYIGHARLECDGLTTWPLDIEHGFAVENLDLGFPAIRGVSNPRADVDGETDETRLFGARAVMLTGTIVPTPTESRQAVLDRLATFLRPDRRPWLIYELEPGSGERQIRLRPDQHARPIVHPGSAKVAAGWRGPDGIQESTALIEATATAAGTESGRVYDRTYDLSYPDSEVVGTATITIGGTLNVPPVIILRGPAVDPRIEKVGTDERLIFEDLELGPDDYLEIDVRARTVLLNGEESRYGNLDFEASTWWTLPPGDTTFRYYPVSFGPGASATVRARAAWI